MSSLVACGFCSALLRCGTIRTSNAEAKREIQHEPHPHSFDLVRFVYLRGNGASTSHFAYPQQRSRRLHWRGPIHIPHHLLRPLQPSTTIFLNAVALPFLFTPA